MSDVNRIYEKALSGKWEIIYPITDVKWGVSRFFVKDPNGVTVNIMSHLIHEKGASRTRHVSHS